MNFFHISGILKLRQSKETVEKAHVYKVILRDTRALLCKTLWTHSDLKSRKFRIIWNKFRIIFLVDWIINGIDDK